MQLLNLLVPVLKLTETVVPKLNGPIGKALAGIETLDEAGQKVVAAVVPVVPAGTPAATFLTGASAVMAEVSSLLSGLTAANAAQGTTPPTAATIATALTPALQELWSTDPALAGSGVSASKIPGLVAGLEGIYNLLTAV